MRLLPLLRERLRERLRQGERRGGPVRRQGFRVCTVALLAVALLAPGCGGGDGTAGTPVDRPGVQLVSSSQSRESPDVDAADIAEVVAGNTAFAFDLYHALAGSGGPQGADATPAASAALSNVAFSPYSVSTALALAYAGARGETAREMAETLHFTLSPEDLHSALNALDGILATRRQEGTGAPGSPASIPLEWHAVNQLWGQTGYTFLPEFLDLLAAQYGAGMRLVDFAADPEAARLTINDWVASQTGRRIQGLLPPASLDDGCVLALTNALYLRAPWQNPFLPEFTAAGDFRLLTGETVRVPFMNMMAEMAYGEGEGWQAAEIPYRDRRLVMLVIVPDEGRFAEVSGGLDAAGLGAILGALAPQEVLLSLPKFEVTTSRSLGDALQALGMVSAFNEGGGADFSGMTGDRSLSVSGVQHQAYVAVDEAGTEAAAATAVTVAAGISEEPAELRADRPFLWLIRDVETGAVLFLGQVVDPSA
ncbi:MAG: serpin family protein [Thermoleophilia bacterium]